MAYLDGFVLPVPVKKLDAYMKIAKKAGKIWMDHGALAYWECTLEDKTENNYCLSFPKAFKPKKGETVIFSYIVFKSRKHRDQVNRKVMKDERMAVYDVRTSKQIAVKDFKAPDECPSFGLSNQANSYPRKTR